MLCGVRRGAGAKSSSRYNSFGEKIHGQLNDSY